MHTLNLAHHEGCALHAPCVADYGVLFLDSGFEVFCCICLYLRLPVCRAAYLEASTCTVHQT